jgi:hypothetical protein
MDNGITISDWAIISVTVLGPILAVQVQRFVDIAREKRQRRLTIFRVLMATRAASLSGAHVEALNAIPIEFYGWRRSYKAVVAAFRDYLNHLGRKDLEPAFWGEKRQDLFFELLWRLSRAVGYDFTKLQMQKEVYFPEGHATLEQEQEVIRRGLYRLFSGEGALPLDIKSFATDPTAVETQLKMQGLLMQLIADGSIKVQLVADNGGTSVETTTTKNSD